MSGDVIITDEGGVRTIRMNRAGKKNAINLAMYDAMTGALESTNASDALRCIIIAGIRGAFTVGNDLADFLGEMDNTDGPNRPATRFLHTLVDCRKPIVAAVNGLAIGIGTTMLLHCDFVVAAGDARFATPFVGLGLVPEAASSLLAPLHFGQRRAFEMLVMGHSFTAAEARALGLVNLVVPSGEVDAEAAKAARAIADLPEAAVRLTRELMRGPVDGLHARMDQENAIFIERLRSGEPRAAIEAFFRRKTPPS
ncbi:MAG TPA: enoyl-CoA hydratase-related protein [Micropepsaceae bacterium]|nr:enoyl-CoA hydratase-related protein [Micropepsaceae bacterium]